MNHLALLGCGVLLVGLIFLVVGVFRPYAVYQKGDGSQKRSARLNINHNPFQSDLSTADPITIVKQDYTWRLLPRAGYQITARVLHSKQYEDWQADFSPVDLALGWGFMSDPDVDRWVEVRQEDRWYFYTKQGNAPFSLDDIRNSSANVHIIPATEALTAVIEELRPNDMVVMEGKLVDVEVDKSGEQFHFQTSLSRFDSADNSCEIFYVERIILGSEVTE